MQAFRELLDHSVDAVYDMIFENEPAFRALLRLSLATPAQGTTTRGGRRIAWLEAALSPVRSRFARAEFKRLVATLAVFLGVECVVVLHDVCALTPRSIRQTARCAARAVLRASLSDQTCFRV